MAFFRCCMCGSIKYLFQLRRQIVPQGFCYACSKIDPGGIFRRPNSYLFKRGFFSACEHFPKAPYTTFVEENPEVGKPIIVLVYYNVNQCMGILRQILMLVSSGVSGFTYWIEGIPDPPDNSESVNIQLK